MIVEAQRAISAQKQVIIHCNKLKTKKKSVWWGLRKPKTTQIPQEMLFNKANSIFHRIPIKEHFGHMEAIRDIYDLMKMQKPRTNNNCVARGHFSYLCHQRAARRVVESLYQCYSAKPSQTWSPKVRSPLPFARTQRKRSFKESKASHELCQGRLPPCWPSDP